MCARSPISRAFARACRQRYPVSGLIAAHRLQLAGMAEPEPQAVDQSAEVTAAAVAASSKVLDVPCVNVLGLPASESPMTIRDLTERLAANPDTRGTWTVYMPPTKPEDALKVDDLVDLEAVDEMDEMDEDDKEELAIQVLTSLEEVAFKSVNEQVGSSGKKRKHPITATSWCTLSEEEARWTAELKAAVADGGTPAEVKALSSGMSDFEYAQYAIISKGDTANALMRMANIAKLRAEYRPEEAVRSTFAGWLAACPYRTRRPKHRTGRAAAYCSLSSLTR